MIARSLVTLILSIIIFKHVHGVVLIVENHTVTGMLEKSRGKTERIVILKNQLFKNNLRD